MLDYYQQKTCREGSCSRVIGAITNKHCRRNQPKVEKNESKKNLLRLARMSPTLRGTQVDFPLSILAKRPLGSRFPFAPGTVQVDDFLSQESAIQTDKITSDGFQISSGRRYSCRGLRGCSLSGSSGE